MSQSALSTGCPRCDARIGQPCKDRHFLRTWQFHEERKARTTSRGYRVPHAMAKMLRCTMSTRVLDVFATNRYIDALETPRFTKTVLRCLVSKVDARTGASHPRFPIVQAAIARAIDYSIAHLCRALNALETLGLVIRRRMPLRRQQDGTVRQLPTDYELRLPALCWREVRPAKGTMIARDDATFAPRLDDAPTFDDEFDGPLTDDDRVELTIRGTMHTPHDTPQSWDVAGFDDRTIPGDEVPAEVVAKSIVDAASIAIERVPDERCFIATNAIYALKQRSMQVALTACNAGLTAARACGVVVQWVNKCLANSSQHIVNGAHALNILRKFIKSAANESQRAHDAARERGRARHYEQLNERHESSSGIMVNRV